MGKSAVLVGCNYPKTPFELHGCRNDVLLMKEVLIQSYGFDSKKVNLITDEPGSEVMPTGANIKAALRDMVKKAEAGDILFFHFSGHGIIIPSLEHGRGFFQDEAIVPCDLNIVTDVDFRHIVNQASAKRATITILSDSCHSGGLIDKEKEQIGPSATKSRPSVVPHRTKGISLQGIHHALSSIVNTVQATADIIHTGSGIVSGVVSGIGNLLNGIFGKDASLKFITHDERELLVPLKDDDGIQLSGCQANETSADVVVNGEKPHGAFTNAVVKVLKDNPGGITNKRLVMEVRKLLQERGFGQHPCLYCSDKNAISPFLGQSSNGWSYSSL